MTAILLASSALVPAFLLLWFFYSRDRNPEPAGMIARVFLLGALAVFPVVPFALALQELGKGATGTWAAALASAFLDAAIPEECCKLLVLRGWAWRRPAFDEPMDGMVYGATASLGFAAFENLMYVDDGGLGLAALRAFTAVPGHALTGAIMGAYVGRAKFGQPGGSVLKGLLCAVLLHGLYDTFLFTQTGFALLALAVLVVEAVWARRLIRALRDGQIAALPTLLDQPEPMAPAVPPPGAPAPSGRVGWAIFKILLGGLGASAGTLLVALFVVAWLLPASDRLSGGDASVASAVVGVPTLLFLLLFRSGIRGLPGVR